jgi:hypothetical protein
MLDAMTLPGESIVHDPQGATIVFVYFPQQKRVYSKRVETGTVYGTEIQIKSGLAGDESGGGGRTGTAARRRGGRGSAVEEASSLMNPVKASLRYPLVSAILATMAVAVGIHAFLTCRAPRTPASPFARDWCWPPIPAPLPSRSNSRSPASSKSTSSSSRRCASRRRIPPAGPGWSRSRWNWRRTSRTPISSGPSCATR